MRSKPPIPDSVKLPRINTKRISFIFVVSLATLAAVCSRTTNIQQTTNDWTRYHNKSFKVSRVVDGDTLDIHVPDKNKPVTRIRLWGVDTPEVRKSKTGVMHFGPEASAFAKKTLEGRTVYIVLAPKKSRGKYGRLLAYVFLQRGGTMFNELLLEQGFAYADLRFKHSYYDQFKKIDIRSRKSAIGLWANIRLDQMPAWKQRFEQRQKKSRD